MDSLDTLRSIPQGLQSQIDMGMHLAFFFFGLFVFGMYTSYVWLISHGVESASLLASPIYFRLMILGGLYGFLTSLCMTFFVLPLWYDHIHQS